MPKKYSIFFDADGVIAKWNPEGKWQEEGYFLALTPEWEVVGLIKALKKAGYNVNILTCYPTESAKKEKIAWFKKVGLEEVPQIYVPYGQNKAEYIKEMADKNILIDDYSHNLHEWRKAGNIGIKFFNGINGTNGTWKGLAISCMQSIEEMAKTILSVA